MCCNRSGNTPGHTGSKVTFHPSHTHTHIHTRTQQANLGESVVGWMRIGIGFGVVKGGGVECPVAVPDWQTDAQGYIVFSLLIHPIGLAAS